LPIVTIAAEVIVGQYGLVQIRPFDEADAPATAELVRPLQPGILVTPAFLAHRERSEPERAQRRSWLAVEEGEVLGFATSAVKWDEPGALVGRFWIGVRPDRRSGGIGATLYDLAERHAREVGAERLTVEVDDNPDGLRFVEGRGFERVSAEIVSSLDPRVAEVDELDGLLVETSAGGFELKTLQAMGERRDDLAAFYEAAGAWPPGGDETNRITADDLWRYIFERPDLSWDGSFLVLDERGRLVSLASLVVDALQARAENEWTATLPEVRGRRLALLVKLASIRWARQAGIREIVTANDDDNLPMLTLNRRLGYRRLYAQVELARAL
jgi:GNAT superfamily N-acetyltransferase